MNGTRTLWRRSALLAIAVAAAITVVALPATALAKTTTRFHDLPKTLTFSNDDPLVNPWPLPTPVIKLQKKSGSSYKALSGTVSLYKLNEDTGSYVKIATAPKATTAQFQIPGIGRYKVHYSGSSTYKSCTAYTNAVSTFGLTVSDPVVTFDPIVGTNDTMVSVAYQVNWNTNAYDTVANGPLMLNYDATFYNPDPDSDDMNFTMLSRNFWHPGTVAFSYRCNPEELLPKLEIDTSVNAFSDLGEYLVTPGFAPFTVDVVN